MTDEDTKKTQNSPFTVDEKTSTTPTEMPSVTRLLNRKKFNTSPKKDQPSPPPTPPPPPSFPSPPQMQPPAAPVAAREESAKEELLQLPQSGDDEGLRISTEAVPPAPSTPATKAVTLPAASAGPKNPPPKLEQWDALQLMNSTDPLAKGISFLLGKNSVAAVFLSLRANEKTPAVPQFVATAFAGKTAKIALWSGVRWDPALTPPLWNYFVRSGYVELSPPDLNTDQNSHRNVMRAAFGVQRAEWLTLLRVGGASACRGVLAVISTGTLSPVVAEVLETLSVLPGSGAPKS